MQTDSFSISELAREFDISSRTIRYYEEKGLISPQRTGGNQRRYNRNDRFRLRWILRGKRFGYSLGEIAEMLGITEIETDAEEQIKSTLNYGEKKLKEIEERIQELRRMQEEMLELKNKLLQRLTDLQQMRRSSHRP